MRSTQQQNDQLIRRIRTQRLKLNIQQKETLERVFRSHLAPDFSEIHHRRLLLHGVPAEFRSYVWTHLLPNHHRISSLNYAQLRQQLAQIHLNPTNYHENPENLIEDNNSKLRKWLGVIEQDIPRTFPQLRIFHNDQEQRDKLTCILGCFAIFRPDIGYIQGLSLLGAIFLQELANEYRAFTAFTTLVTTTILFDFYTFKEETNAKLCEEMMSQLKQKSEELWEYLEEVQLKMVVMEWIMTLFTRVFQLDSVPYIWDILIAHSLSPSILTHLCTTIVSLKNTQILSSDRLAIPKLLKSTRLTLEEEELVLSSLREVQLQ